MAGDRERRIKEHAIGLGCSLVGICRAEPLSAESVLFEEWLNRGMHAGMAWMERRKERRTDPREVLSGARSIIVVGVNYYTPVAHETRPDCGKVSRYAWGEDYHQIVPGMLERLEMWMHAEFPGERSLAYVDTGPLMEKALAVRAGIGWQGKHTNVISPRIGSWIFLGELLTTMDLVPDARGTDHCGTCRRCIDACPTEAIVAPYVLDARRCISYLTIEHRGPVEGDVREKYDGWIFGCDICQDVCPWNDRFAAPASEQGFAPRDGNVAPGLEDIARLGPDEFEKRFAGSPIRRAKWEGLRRNAAIVAEHRRAKSD